MTIYLTEIQLARLTHRSAKSWQRDRIRGGGIPFIRCGGKILYDMTDVQAWLNARKFSSTSAYAGAKITQTDPAPRSAEA